MKNDSIGRRLRLPALFDETGLNQERIKSLRIVIWAIALGTVCFNITEGIAMTGFLKSLDISDSVFGLLYAASPAAGVVQILASYILERTRKRKTIFLIAGLLNRSVWLPFGLVPFIVPMSAPMIRLWMVSLFLLISAVSNQFLAVSYNSMLADLIPMRIRGSFLGTRGRVSTVMGILGGFLTAWLLDIFPGFHGYALVFGLAALLGTIDIMMFFAVWFPPMPEIGREDSIKHMLSDALRNKEFLGLMGFVTIWSFSLNLSVPFYLVYIRMSLGMSNTAIMLIAQILPNICTVIVLSHWGQMLDRRGIRRVMYDIGRWSSIAPVLWLFVAPGPLSMVLIAVTYISTGLLLPGMDVGSQTAILNRSPERNRSMYIALYSCVTTLVGRAFANAAGGWLLDNPLMVLEKMNAPLFGMALNRYNYLFLLTFILRMISAFILLPRMISPDSSNEQP
ncbi:MAG: MFS transporter [Peptococcaceae bacterium]|nr:MFS transporter [Peptococcaceae bacterium]